MLGADQQVASQVMNAAYRAEDLQQLQVRHFRGVLYGASAALLVVVAVLWIVGAIHPAYFPLCWPKSGSNHPICPTGGHAPSAADVPLALGIGALGAALSVAVNLVGLQPAGVRFSLTVAQGLNKIVLGAITALLGIIVLRTVTSAPGFLATQPGLLTTAVVFGYSQQVFTRLIDRQADQLTNAASPAAPAAQLPAARRRSGRTPFGSLRGRGSAQPSGEIAKGAARQIGGYALNTCASAVRAVLGSQPSDCCHAHVAAGTPDWPVQWLQHGLRVASRRQSASRRKAACLAA